MIHFPFAMLLGCDMCEYALMLCACDACGRNVVRRGGIGIGFWIGGADPLQLEGCWLG